MRHNICHFVPFSKDPSTLHTIHFVLETQYQTYNRLKSEAVYKMYYVCHGHGNLHTTGKITPINHGDLFFTFPASPFAIESVNELQYMYISYVGVRGNRILENLGIRNDRFHFPDAKQVQPVWEQGIQTNAAVSAVMSEAVLLYTFAYLADRMLQNSPPPRQSQSTEQIKRYIDEHYTDQNFSLGQISQQLSYNKKYISSVFKKNIGISVIEYLNTVRIQNACTMLQQGFTSITDIADRCGFSDAQYFSRVFRTHIGIAPTQYIRNLQASTEQNPDE